MDGVADGSGALELGELDAEPDSIFEAGWAVSHHMFICLRLEVAYWVYVIICEMAAFESGLCGELVMVEIPHHLPIAAPNFHHPFPDGPPVELRSRDFRSALLSGA